MDERERKLIKESAEVEMELWKLLISKLSEHQQNMLNLYQVMSLERLLLEGVFRAGPAFTRDQTREDLEANVEVARILLQREAGVGE